MALFSLLKFAVTCFDILAWPLFAVGYPLCASIQAIDTNSNSDTQKLIAYWASFSLILLFENAFGKLLEWIPFWCYIKLMIVCFLVNHNFDGSVYVYKRLVHPCLSMNSQIFANGFGNLKALFIRKDKLQVEVERYVKENGVEALENLLASKPKNAKQDLVEQDIKAVAEVDRKKLEEPNSDHKGINAIEITEKKEVPSIQQVSQNAPNLHGTDNRIYVPVVIKEVATAPPVKRVIPDIAPPKNKVPNEWTCAICEVTTTSESDLLSHLRGSRHKAACAGQGASNQASKSKDSTASVDKKCWFPKEEPELSATNGTSEGKRLRSKKQETQQIPQIAAAEIVVFPWCCTICNVTCLSKSNVETHLSGKKHLSKTQGSHVAGSTGQA